MRLTQDKISHMSHLLIDGAVKAGLIAVKDPARLLQVTKEVLTHYGKMDEALDQIVRKKLASYSKKPLEGSREWDILYRKHFQEELNKRQK